MGHGLRITAGTFKGRVLKTGDGPGERPAPAPVRAGRCSEPGRRLRGGACSLRRAPPRAG